MCAVKARTAFRVRRTDRLEGDRRTGERHVNLFWRTKCAGKPAERPKVQL